MNLIQGRKGANKTRPFRSLAILLFWVPVTFAIQTLANLTEPNHSKSKPESARALICFLLFLGLSGTTSGTAAALSAQFSSDLQWWWAAPVCCAEDSCRGDRTAFTVVCSMYALPEVLYIGMNLKDPQDQGQLPETVTSGCCFFPVQLDQLGFSASSPPLNSQHGSRIKSCNTIVSLEEWQKLRAGAQDLLRRSSQESNVPNTPHMPHLHDILLTFLGSE